MPLRVIPLGLQGIDQQLHSKYHSCTHTSAIDKLLKGCKPLSYRRSLQNVNWKKFQKQNYAKNQINIQSVWLYICIWTHMYARGLILHCISSYNDHNNNVRFLYLYCVCMWQSKSLLLKYYHYWSIMLETPEVTP